MTFWIVVEDDLDIQLVLRAMLETWGIQGLIFSDGLDVLYWLADYQQSDLYRQRPLLALIDIRLPHVSGIQVAASLRASPLLAGMTIVLMTAHRLTPFQEREALQLSSADLLIYKPLLPMPQLRAMLENLLRVRTRG